MSTALELKREQPTPLELIQEALRGAQTPEEKLAATGMVKELIALQQSMVRFEWEAQERQSKIDFDNALNECQSKIGRIAPNAKRENGIGWADYAQVDRNIRPVYIPAGFSIGFSEVESGDPNRLKICATLSRGGVSREYFQTISRTAPNSKMNALDADAGAASRVQRYLLLKIFNIAQGIDPDEKKPYEAEQKMPQTDLDEWVQAINQAPDDAFGDVLRKAYEAAAKCGCDVARLKFDLAGIRNINHPVTLKNFYLARAKKWEGVNSQAAKDIGEAFDKRKAELEGQS